MNNYERCKEMSLEEMAVALAMNDDGNGWPNILPMYYTWLCKETKIAPHDFDDIIEKYKDRFFIEEDETDINLDLVSKEQYIKDKEPDFIPSFVQWSRPKYLCPECKKGGMREDYIHGEIIATHPPIYLKRYVCNKCGYTETLNV